MYKILNKQILNKNVKLIVVKAPVVARKARAGQFVIVRINETGERIPLTIADYSPQDETITLIFQEIGKSTMQMGRMEVGDGFENVVGPLGHPTEIQNYGRVVLVGGGVGIATLFPIARALKQAGNFVFLVEDRVGLGLQFGRQTLDDTSLLGDRGTEVSDGIDQSRHLPGAIGEMGRPGRIGLPRPVSPGGVGEPKARGKFRSTAERHSQVFGGGPEERIRDGRIRTETDGEEDFPRSDI